MTSSIPFAVFHKRVREVIRDIVGLKEATSVQKLAVPLIHEGRSLLVIGPTGSGKTEAAFLPIIDRIFRDGIPEGVNVVYINPLKALTRDIHKRISVYAHLLGLAVRPLYGDVVKSYRRPTPNIIITTPESLEVILDWAPSWWPFLENVRYVIVDEVHELIDSKRGAQLLILLERLKRINKKGFQRIGLSATVSDPSTVARLLGGSDGALEVVVAPEGRLYKFCVSAAVPKSEDEEKDVFLAAMRRIVELVGDRKTLAFVNSRLTAERLQYALKELGLGSVAVHHGSVSKEEREMIEHEFKTNVLRCVVATKTLELGIDIENVEQVLQYRSSGSVSTLLQRAGRSGHRPGFPAECVIISSEPDDLLEGLSIVKLAKEGFRDELELVEWPLDVVAKEVTGMALQASKREKTALRKGKLTSGVVLSPKEVYEVITSSPLFSSLKWEDFLRVLKVLEDNEIIEIDVGIRVGRGFWRLWAFDTSDKRRRWARGFAEFFSMIPKRDSFTVFDERGSRVGDLDATFVYRSMRTGMVLRLAGRNWVVSEIDEPSCVVRVAETGEKGEVPYWKGEGPPRSARITQEMVHLLEAVTKNPSVLKDLGADDVTVAVLSGFVDNHLKAGGRVPSLDTIVVEKVPNQRAVFFLSLFGEKVNRALASVIVEKISERTLLLSYAVAPYGFVIVAPLADPVEVLKTIRESEVSGLVTKFLEEHSPHVRMLLLELSAHFGMVSGSVAGADLVHKEAERQVRKLYFDEETAKEILAKIKSGDVKLDMSVRDEPSPFAAGLLSWPLERPWGLKLSELLKQVLDRPRTLEELRQFTWEDASAIKESMRTLSEEIFIVALLDAESKGMLPAKIPRDGSWGSTTLPCNVRYFVLKDVKDMLTFIDGTDYPTLLKKLRERGYSEVEISVKSPKESGWMPYRFSFSDRLPVLLEIYRDQRFIPMGKKIDLKVHIAGSSLTVIYWASPSMIINYIITNILYALEKLFSKISGQGQLVIELP